MFGPRPFLDFPVPASVPGPDLPYAWSSTKFRRPSPAVCRHSSLTSAARITLPVQPFRKPSVPMPQFPRRWLFSC